MTSNDQVRQEFYGLIAALRCNAQGVSLAADGVGWSTDLSLFEKAADMLEAARNVGVRQEEEIRRLEAALAQAPQAVPLSEERLLQLLFTCTDHPPVRLPPGYVAFARAIDAALSSSAEESNG